MGLKGSAFHFRLGLRIASFWKKIIHDQKLMAAYLNL